MNDANDRLDALIDNALAPVARLEASHGFTGRVMQRLDAPAPHVWSWRAGTLATAMVLAVLAVWLRQAPGTPPPAPQGVLVLEGRTLPAASLILAAPAPGQRREATMSAAEHRIAGRPDVVRAASVQSRVPIYDGLRIEAVSTTAVDAGTAPLVLSPVPQLSPVVIDHVTIAPIDTTHPASPSTPDVPGGHR